MEEVEGSAEQQASAPKPPGGKLSVNEASESLRPSPSRATASVKGVEVVGVDLALPFGPLKSADDLKTPFTNYTSGYKALLDCCWYEPGKMEVVGGVAVPSEGEMQGFIPNAAFPSDHQAVVYKLKLLS